MRISLILLSALVAAASAAPSQAQGKRDPGELLNRADLNSDGKITRSEFIQGRGQLFARFDRNRDGYLNRDDAPKRGFAGGRGGMLRGRNGGGGAGERLQQAMQALDTNDDRRISRAEFVDGPTLIFDRADRDRNGIIDHVERTEFSAAAGGRR
jgi:Ca2+-binding EF-hand superfamily protein